MLQQTLRLSNHEHDILHGAIWTFQASDVKPFDLLELGDKKVRPWRLLAGLQRAVAHLFVV